MVTRSCNPSYLGDRGRRLTWTGTQEVEVAVSWYCTTALQRGLQSETQSQKNKTKQKQKLAGHGGTWEDRMRPVSWGCCETQSDHATHSSLGDRVQPCLKQRKKERIPHEVRGWEKDKFISRSSMEKLHGEIVRKAVNIFLLRTQLRLHMVHCVT